MCDDMNSPGCYCCHANTIDGQRPIKIFPHNCWPELVYKLIKEINTYNIFIIKMETIRQSSSVIAAYKVLNDFPGSSWQCVDQI